MQRRICSSLFALLCVTSLSFGVAHAEDKTLSLVSTTGQSKITVNEGDPIAIEVRIDNASIVAGASFTVTYDTANLALTSVDSSFFGTFVSQNIPTPSGQGYVTVDNKDYDRPIVDNTVSGLQSSVTTGSMLAAAKVENGTGLNVKLFTLNFTLTGSPGTYPVSIIQSKISNTDAGYSADGEFIPFLVGIGTSGTYPAHSVSTVNPASLVISPAILDADGDKIDDDWEIANVPLGTPGDPLDVFSENGDYDEDGYSDYQEYLNRDSQDPEGNAFDPTVVNAPGGDGYGMQSDGSAIVPALLIMLDLENE
ncbi:hypothetical protein [Desulfosediminicola flagellatus]|uniref:hypothetical protein n=1 Tax=Desulfosediminicola flagellatus TaxID=2569541 RepID=UPI0010ADA03A|nr:hypothetical protein [Desulfosediminicola flagellatus]